MKWLKAIFTLLVTAVTPMLDASATVQSFSSYVLYTGTGTNSGDVLFTTTNTAFYDTCLLMSVTGAVQVFPSLDGTNFVTSALSLADLHLTTSDPVTSTVAGAMYGFSGRYPSIQVKQTGASASSASLLCYVGGQVIPGGHP